MKCEYCNKEFASKTNLNYHLKNTKFCLKLRGEDTTTTNFVCNFCEKCFTTKRRLETHFKICKEQLSKNNFRDKNETIIILENKLEEKNQIISDLKLQIEDLQNRLERICNKAIEKPTNIIKNTDITNNNFLNNIGVLNLDPDKLEDIFMNRMTFQHVIDGQLGVANLIHQHFLVDENNNPLAVCTDKARQIIKYKGDNGNIVKDPKGYQIASKIYNISEKAAMKVREGYIQNVYNNEPVKLETLEDDDEKQIIVDKRCFIKLKRLLCKKMKIEMDNQGINSYPDDAEIERQFNYRFEKLKSKTLDRPKKFKKRKEPDDKAIRYFSRLDKNVPQEDSDLESDYDEIIEEEDEEFKLNGEEEYKLWCKLQDSKKEKNEERLRELKLVVEAKGWSQDKKDYYLDKINKGLDDIKSLRINVNKFGKALSISLPSE
jgi:hypothetical protein